MTETTIIGLKYFNTIGQKNQWFVLYEFELNDNELFQ